MDGGIWLGLTKWHVTNCDYIPVQSGCSVGDDLHSPGRSASVRLRVNGAKQTTIQCTTLKRHCNLGCTENLLNNNTEEIWKSVKRQKNWLSLSNPMGGCRSTCQCVLRNTCVLVEEKEPCGRIGRMTRTSLCSHAVMWSIKTIEGFWCATFSPVYVSQCNWKSACQPLLLLILVSKAATQEWI